MSNLTRKGRQLFIAAILLCCCMYSKAQVSPTETKNGFSLQKSSSLSTVNSGDVFTYTVTFSIPAGGTYITISDVIPSPLVIDNVIVPASYSGFVPTVTTSGSTVNVAFNYAVTSSISGSFQVNVHFPVDSACNGQRVINSAQLSAKIPETYLITKGLTTTSVVNNPWRIQKYPNNLTYVGGTCPYGTLSDTVDYTVRIVKQNWVTSGSASWYNIGLQDILPSGAYVITSSYSCTANMTGSSISPTGTISLPSGFKLDANGYNVYQARFKIVNSPIPVGSCVVNTAALTGQDFCGNKYTDTSRVGVQKIVPTPNGQLAKWASVNGNLPGCTGTYFIRVCNTGSGTLPAYTLSDNFPTCLTGITPNPPPAGCSITGGPYNYVINGVAIPPGQCATFSFSFTIGTGCPSTIINTVTATSGFTGSSSAGIALLPPTATACLTKTICGPTPAAYTVGSTVRFRLRVQNIGGTPISLADIQDQLDNNNLEYVGNELYYSYPNPFAPCAPSNTIIPPGASAWSIAGTSHNPTTGLLKWKLPDIGVECGNVPYPACGFAYGLRAYYIEFSVKIKDTAGLGNILNCATIANGNVTTPVTSCATFVTNGTVNYTIDKQVSNDNGASYSSSVTASAGSIVTYKLGAVNSGVGLINPVLVDLLPRDNGSSDNFITYCTARGSVYDIWYNAFVSSSHTYSSQSFSNTPGITVFPELGATCTTAAPGWVGAPPSGTLNLKTQLSQAIGSTPLAYVFNAKTDASAQPDDVACNSYALRGSVKYIINYATNYVLQTALESGKACVTIQKAGCCDPYDFVIPKEVCFNYNNQYCVKDSCNPSNVYTWDFGDGSPTVTGSCINYAYTHPGGYTITVSWKNDCGDYRKDFDIKVNECPCDVKVAFSILANGLTITADGTPTTSSMPIIAYVWDYGDGTFGTGPVANHTYSSGGSYIVTLTVYAIDAKGNICECRGACRTEIYVDKDKRNKFGCNLDKKVAVAASNVVLKASPNPFRDNIVVNFDIVNKTKVAADQSGYTLSLINSTGVILQTQKLADLQRSITLKSGSYASGTYFVILKNNSGEIQSTTLVKL